MNFVQPPRANQKPKNISYHNDERQDPWYWLRQEDDPEVQTYIAQENSYTQAYFAQTGDLQEKLFQELKSYINEDDESVPTKDGPYWYFSSIKAGLQYPVYKRSREASATAPEIILDINALAQGKSFFEIGFCEHSPNHRFLAYSVDLSGEEEYTIYIKDLETGQLLPETFAKASSSFAWCNDSQGFYYGVLDDNYRPKAIYGHRLGENPEVDLLVYEEKDPRFFVSLDQSESCRFIYICSEGNNMSEWYFLDATTLNKPLTLIAKRQRDHEYDVSDHGELFFIRTNLNACDYRLVTTPINFPSCEHWQDFIPQRPGCLLEDFHLYQDFLAIQERQAGVPSIRYFNFNSQTFTAVPFSDDVCELSLMGSFEYATPWLRLCYQSLKCPPCIYDIDMRTGERELKKKYHVPIANFREDDYLQTRVFATASDGSRIPISLIYHRNTTLGPTTPLLINGYGAYGLNQSPEFSTHYFPLLNRGFIVALAHIRGGMELGESWYQQGKLLTKKNTFSDFIACCEALIAHDYTGKGMIIASGGSAGGMLMGVVVNERPELFRAVLAHVPFVDVLTSMLDEDLPLTVAEYNEWGNPQEKIFYDYIKSYSPYDNVKKQVYPAMFIVSALADTRVAFWEPMKWVAKLRQHHLGNQAILLKMDLDAGHCGASGRYDYLRETAQDLTFIMNECQIPFLPIRTNG